MISKVPDIKNTDNDKQRQIEIKEAQLKIALESNMAFVAEGLQKQLSELKGQALEPKKQEFQVKQLSELKGQVLEPKKQELQVKQLSELKGRVSTAPDREFQALMGLLDD